MYEAVYISEFLKERKCLFIEHLFDKGTYELSFILKHKNILPVFASESIATYSDLEKHHTHFNGINIKLMKCGDIKNALKMIAFARKLNLKVMMGA